MHPQRPGTRASVPTLAHRGAHYPGGPTETEAGWVRAWATQGQTRGNCSAGRRPGARTPCPWGRPAPQRGQRQNSLPRLPQSRSRSLPVHRFLFFSQKEGRGGLKKKKKMLHCAARPVSERRGANQRPPFRKLPFMARAAAAAPYITRRREAQPPPRPRPPRQHRPLAFAAPPSPPVDTATR